MYKYCHVLMPKWIWIQNYILIKDRCKWIDQYKQTDICDVIKSNSIKFKKKDKIWKKESEVWTAGFICQSLLVWHLLFTLVHWRDIYHEYSYIKKDMVQHYLPGCTIFRNYNFNDGHFFLAFTCTTARSSTQLLSKNCMYESLSTITTELRPNFCRIRRHSSDIMCGVWSMIQYWYLMVSFLTCLYIHAGTLLLMAGNQYNLLCLMTTRKACTLFKSC
jgi:hypothetical protein